MKQYYITAKDTGQKLSPFEPGDAVADPSSQDARICLHTGRLFQTHLGIGGAFTDAAAVNFDKLDDAKQAEVLEAYFDPEVGNAYSLARVNIHSCDFSLGNYDYLGGKEDPELTGFSIEPDRELRIPFIKRAFEQAGGPIPLLASPWSPPAFMKDSKRMNRGGKLLPEYRAAWADYYGKFIQAYEAEGIPVWGVSVQNEPEATQTWDSCLYTPAEERDFVRDHLGPTLEKHGLAEKNIVIWDHNRDHLFERAKVVYDDPEAAKYIWGAGFHWYDGDHFENLNLAHDVWPEKQLLFTEGCQEGGTHDGAWALGERYGRSMINDFNRWTTGWLDWNLLLDEKGGPNHVNNLCSAPILVDTQSGELRYQNSYYYIGHFSRFIPPGSRRLAISSSRDNLLTTAYLRPDKAVAMVIMNLDDQAYTCEMTGDSRTPSLQVPAHSIITIIEHAELR
jgi:glucosylceramidase